VLLACRAGHALQLNAISCQSTVTPQSQRRLERHFGLADICAQKESVTVLVTQALRRSNRCASTRPLCIRPARAFITAPGSRGAAYGLLSLPQSHGVNLGGKLTRVLALTRQRHDCASWQHRCAVAMS
jgi:hypothetical protein